MSTPIIPKADGYAARLWGRIRELLWCDRIDIWTVDSTAKTQPEDSLIPGNVQFTRADKYTIRRMAEDAELLVSRTDVQYLEGLLDEGSFVFVGNNGNHVVYYAAAAVGRKRLWTRYFRLGEKEFFVMRCFTKARYRGQHIHVLALRYICDELFKAGFETGYLDTVATNAAAVRGVKRIAANRTGSHYYRIRVFGYDMILPRGPLKSRFQ